MDLTSISETLFNALSSSSILILAALGLAITFGVMRVINMAHGEMLMLGAYTAFVLEDKTAIPVFVRNTGRNVGALLNWLFGLWDKLTGSEPVKRFQFDWQTDFGLEISLFWAIPTAFLFVSCVGYLLEVSLVRRLYGRPLDTLLATWGVGIILQQLVNISFGPELKPMHMPEVLKHKWEMGELAIPTFRVFIAGIACLCLLAVYLWFYKTSFGLKIRAVVQNRPMASALGISTRRVDSLTFALASGLAGVAGCILAHQYNAGYTMGNQYIVKAFMVVILGGMGHMAGSVGAGVVIGTSESLIAKVLGSEWLKNYAGWLGISADTWNRVVGSDTETLAWIAVLFVIIAFILLRPSGLFATKERSYE